MTTKEVLHKIREMVLYRDLDNDEKEVLIHMWRVLKKGEDYYV